MAALASPQLALRGPSLLPDYRRYPPLRYMGSKNRLLPWIESVLCEIPFESALDAFAGSGSVAYLLKAMGKQVHANDFLRFAADFSRATVENSDALLDEADMALLLTPPSRHPSFVQDTFRGIFFDDVDRAFIDQLWSRLSGFPSAKRSMALAALYRACLKRQPRGVFTVGTTAKYDDGRRDLRVTLQQHFIESVQIFNDLVFDNGLTHRVTCGDALSLGSVAADLVYLDPPYVPRADDNCYIKRYHFLEGLASYWHGVEFHPGSKVRKLKKRYTPFSYRREAEVAFRRLFAQFAASTIVLSYSSNGYPDIDVLVSMLGEFKSRVTVHAQEHRYHFGTHASVLPERAQVTEYLIVGD